MIERVSLLFALALVSWSLGCAPPAETAPDNVSAARASQTPPANHPPVGGAAGPMTHGTVKEAIDAGSYTYVRVESGDVETWLAGPRLAVAVGDEVVYGEGMPMNDWHSDSLDRTWRQVLFVSELRLAGAVAPTTALPDMPPGHPPVAAGEPAAVGVVQKLAEGQTIAELYARSAELAGKEVAVRGQVVKANYGILGRNWIHLRDGSGSAASADDDLTVTSSDRVDLGQVVSIRGKLTLDKDFGAGYRYPLIVEDARLWVD